MINKFFEKQYTSDTPGIGVMAICNEKVVYEEYVGLANVEHKIPINKYSVFNIGSISKQFTAQAILCLIEEKKLMENDLVVKYIPEISSYADEMTIYHLVHHSSGLSDYNDLLYLKARNNSLYATNDEVLELFKKETSLKFQPGKCFDYSNTNYVLLAIIIERLTNKSFEQYMKESIFNKADMKQTVIFNQKQAIVPNRAYGYEYLSDELKCWYVDSLTTGCTNTLTSMADMYKYDQWLYFDKLLSNEMKSKLIQPGLDRLNQPIYDWCGAYGYGWMIQDLCGEKIICHSGGEAGFNCLYIRFYEKHFSILIFTNTNTLNWNKAYEMSSYLFKRYS